MNSHMKEGWPAEAATEIRPPLLGCCRGRGKGHGKGHSYTQTCTHMYTYVCKDAHNICEYTISRIYWKAAESNVTILR